MLKSLKEFLQKLKPIRSLYVAYDSGAKNKPTVVLLHGIAATSKSWDFLIKELDMNKYRVVALDLLGFGQSPSPAGCKYTVDDHVKYIRKTLNRIGVKKPFTIVGHSMGSIIAARYCRLYPLEIKNSYLLSLPLYIKNKKPQKSIHDVETDLYLGMYKFLLDNKGFAIKSSQRLRKLLKLKDGIDVTEENWEGFKLSLKNVIINQNTHRDIENSKVPMNVIFGDLDEFLVQKYVSDLSVFDHVKVTKINIADHQIGPRFAKKVAEYINSAE